MSLHVCIKKKLGAFALDADFCAPNGRTAILGASGSGKSVLLRCIAGIMKPDSGSIHMEQRVLFDAQTHTCVKPQKRRIGYLFQQYALFDTMTVRQNIQAGMPGNRRQKQQETDRLLEQFRLTELAQRHPERLSGGQKQRVALARMLAAKPDCLLLDEPFSALDTQLRGQVRRQMAELLDGHDGTTLLVTHDFEEAVQLCAHVVVIADGKTVEHASCMDLWEHPRTRAGAELTGMTNFIDRSDACWPALAAGQTDAPYIGIRPEDLRLAQSRSGIELPGEVRRILPAIDGKLVCVSVIGKEILWKAKSGEHVEAGQALTLSVLPQKRHFLHD